jgi:uncharacterized protein with PQ loop repeat
MGKYGFLATTSLMFNVISFTSLLMSIYKTKVTASFNWLYLLGNIIAQMLLIIYGILNNAPEIYGPTILLLFGLLYIVYIKFTYHYDEKNL